MQPDPEERKNRKIGKCARNAAYTGGLGLGLWIVTMLWQGYEDEKSAAAMHMFSNFGLALLLYAAVVLGFVAVKRNLAPFVNMVLFWLVLPAYIFYLVSHWPG